jgi:molybdopterin molybdotransferase
MGTIVPPHPNPGVPAYACETPIQNAAMSRPPIEAEDEVQQSPAMAQKRPHSDSVHDPPQRPISYKSALSILATAAGANLTNPTMKCEELLPTPSALGRVLAANVYAPMSTPPMATSAMDGFALNSAHTVGADCTNPIRFRVVASVTAGEEPPRCSNEADPEGDCVVHACVEIATGAWFPKRNGQADRQSFYETEDDRGPFDAVVPIEHVKIVSLRNGSPYLIEITKPATWDQHRRPAGGDFQRGKVALESGVRIEPHHVMALASLGIREVSVKHNRADTKIRVGLWSTGNELIRGELSRGGKGPRVGAANMPGIEDANGPYLSAALAALGCHVEFLGVISDTQEAMVAAIHEEKSRKRFDILITTGAVSMGKKDFVRSAVETCGARVEFHKVAIRPGHPVLFATFPERDLEHTTASGHRDVAFFGLPGNPLATVACFRFLVVPYLKALTKAENVCAEERIMAVVKLGTHFPTDEELPVRRKPFHLDVFWHGVNWIGEDGVQYVDIHPDQSSGKTKPLLAANCWIHVPAGVILAATGDKLDCYPLLPGPLQ